MISSLGNAWERGARLTMVSHLFDSDEYLAEDADIETGMTPEAYVHISLDLADPGRQAVGFELQFR